MQIGHILLEETERHDGFRAFLYLINEEECTSRLNSFLCQGRNYGDDAVHVKVRQKGRFILRFTFEVDLYITLKLLTQMPDGSGFPHLSGSAKQNRFVDAA